MSKNEEKTKRVGIQQTENDNLVMDRKTLIAKIKAIQHDLEQHFDPDKLVELYNLIKKL